VKGGFRLVIGLERSDVGVSSSEVVGRILVMTVMGNLMVEEAESSLIFPLGLTVAHSACWYTPGLSRF
jgi:hypothetical protein